MKKADTADFKVATQECRGSKFNVARDYMTIGFLFSFAGGDVSDKSASVSAIC